MRIDLLILLSRLLDEPFANSILDRAQERGICEIHFHKIHDYRAAKQKQTNDYLFGGGAGMVMTIQTIDDFITELKS